MQSRKNSQQALTSINRQSNYLTSTTSKFKSQVSTCERTPKVGQQCESTSGHSSSGNNGRRGDIQTPSSGSGGPNDLSRILNIVDSKKNLLEGNRESEKVELL